uniref:Uncharacterized protein n=1 Tax=Eubacterium cellulosolvens (strain ATCC 43171 / JCM 9499 / 6) TaxID=633697 RepID=I5AT63_EUBC6
MSRNFKKTLEIVVSICYYLRMINAKRHFPVGKCLFFLSHRKLLRIPYETKRIGSDRRVCVFFANKTAGYTGGTHYG